MNDGLILPDLLADGLMLVLCGTAVGKTSESVNAYYAGRGNKFWSVLAEVGLAPRLAPVRYRELLQHGIGLTDLVKHVAGNDSEIVMEDYDTKGLRCKILRYAPKVLAFNGKAAAKRFFHTRVVNFGWQSEQIGSTRVFVLPSTSGSANGYWNVSWWRELAVMLKGDGDACNRSGYHQGTCGSDPHQRIVSP